MRKIDQTDDGLQLRRSSLQNNENARADETKPTGNFKPGEKGTELVNDRLDDSCPFARIHL